MEVMFLENINTEPKIGRLKYYYNGMFYIDYNGKTYEITESQLCKDPNNIQNIGYYVGTGGRNCIFTTTQFNIAEAFANGYNEAITYQDTWEESDLAKVYFGEY